MRPLIKFGEYTIQRNWKNEEFEETYPMRDADRRRILDSLSAEDCIRINRNTNPRYDDAEVFVFLKDAAVYIYGEMENIK